MFRNLLLVAALWAALPLAQAADPITIAQVIDFSGPNNDTGRDYWTGAKICFDYVNAHGGVNGHPIADISVDDHGDPAATVSAVRKLEAEQRPVVLFGMLGADNVRAVLNDRDIARRHIPVFAPYVGIDAEVGMGDVASVYYVRGSSAEEIGKISRMTAAVGVSRIALFTSDDALGRSASEETTRVLAAEGRALVSRASIPADSGDVEGAVASILRGKPQVVILAAPTLASASFVQSYLKRSPGTQFYALSSINHQTLHEFLGDSDSQWVAVTTLTPSPYTPTTAVAREFVRVLKQYRDEPPSYSAMEGYIAARMLVEVLKTSHDLTPAGIHHAIETMAPRELGGFTVDFHHGTQRGTHFVDVAVFSHTGTMVN